MPKSRYIARIVDSVLADPSISKALKSHNVDKFTSLLVEDEKFSHILRTPAASKFVDAISKDERVISLLRVPTDSIVDKIIFHPNFKNATAFNANADFTKLSGAIDGMSNNVSSLRRDVSSIGRKFEASRKDNAATIQELSKYLRSSASAIDLGLNGILKKLDLVQPKSAVIDDDAISKIINHPAVSKFMEDIGKIGSAMSGKIEELSQKIDNILKSLSSSAAQSQKSQEKEIDEAIKGIPEDDKKKKENEAHRSKMASAGRKIIAGYGISALAYLVPSATAFGVGLFSVLSFGGGVLVLWGVISLVRNYKKHGW